jgi:hypothetical protein
VPSAVVDFHRLYRQLGNARDQNVEASWIVVGALAIAAVFAVILDLVAC